MAGAECEEKKGTVVRLIRLDQVKGAKEIR